MSISDKTRKVLWGRSGNRCVICKRELVIDSTFQDDESVVGEECHIVSPKENGPRYDPSYPGEKIDTYENIMLLCRVDHKMADDQVEAFTTDILRQMKANHEIWVTTKLADRPAPPRPLRIRRVEERTPDFLSRLTSGKQVLELASSGYAYSMDHDELRSQSEVDLVGGFLQIISEWGDLIDDLEPSDRVSIAYT